MLSSTPPHHTTEIVIHSGDGSGNGHNGNGNGFSGSNGNGGAGTWSVWAKLIVTETQRFAVEIEKIHTEIKDFAKELIKLQTEFLYIGESRENHDTNRFALFNKELQFQNERTRDIVGNIEKIKSGLEDTVRVVDRNQDEKIHKLEEKLDKLKKEMEKLQKFKTKAITLLATINVLLGLALAVISVIK